MSSSKVVQDLFSVLDLEAKALARIAAKISDPDSDESKRLVNSVEIIADRLKQGGRVVVVGLGKSGKVGQKISATLSSTGCPSFFLHPTEALHGDLGMVAQGDVVLALSYTGNTDEVIKLIPALKSLDVPVISIVGHAESRLAKSSREWIDGSVETEACPHNLAPTTSTTVALALGDALAIALMKLRGFDAESFAKNHPGGALGRRLTLRVEDLMHQGANVPTVSASASMDEVVSLSTQKKLGVVLVCEADQKLKGIITDGDLRRALKHRERFFQMTASEVMTQKPIAASPKMMAREALELMENRPSQISVLPVVDESGKWRGVIRLHDLVQLL
ncbi:MAG: KpsF/GutQ family sugar-phosphate isomerase [Bdellovibrionales bacterium]|nr:KpsF/GutQ family sugar-phosphate isomerase [Bdellovibrionales bacterium]